MALYSYVDLDFMLSEWLARRKNGGGLGKSWKPCYVLRALWAVLGRSWARFGSSSGNLGAVLKRLGAVLRHLGAISMRFGVRLGVVFGGDMGRL